MGCDTCSLKGTCGVNMASSDKKAFDEGYDNTSWNKSVQTCSYCGSRLVFSDKRGWICKRCKKEIKL